MTPENFTWWLQGYSEICGDTPTEEQWRVICDHLQIVFEKVTPDRREPTYCKKARESVPLEIDSGETQKEAWANLNKESKSREAIVVC